MRLSEFANKIGIHYKTAYRWYREGKINGAKQLKTGVIYVPETALKDILGENVKQNRAIIYARVSSRDQKENLERQAERLKQYAITNGYRIIKVVKEIGSGMNDNRKKLNQIFDNLDEFDVIIVEYKDRLTRFGFNYIEKLLKKLGKTIVVVNETETEKEDLLKDLISVIYSFSARLYSVRRRSKVISETKKILTENFKK